MQHAEKSNILMLQLLSIWATKTLNYVNMSLKRSCCVRARLSSAVFVSEKK